MTEREALLKAQRLWGETAAVKRTKKPMSDGSTHRVGRIEMGMFFAVKGSGKSWAAAFKDARSH